MKWLNLSRQLHSMLMNNVKLDNNTKIKSINFNALIECYDAVIIIGGL